MGRARALLIQAGIDSKGKGEFWCEVILQKQSWIIQSRGQREQSLHTPYSRARMQNT